MTEPYPHMCEVCGRVGANYCSIMPPLNQLKAASNPGISLEVVTIKSPIPLCATCAEKWRKETIERMQKGEGRHER